MFWHQNKYKDAWVKFFGSLFCSHFIEVMGRTESIFQLLRTKSYLLALSSGFVISWILWTYVSRVTVFLDERYDWFTHTVQRIFLQLLLGVFLSAGWLYLLTLVQMRWLFHQDINEVEYLLYEFPAACLLIVLVNTYYLVYYLFKRASASAFPTQALALAAMPSAEVPAPEAETDKKTNVLLVNRGEKTLPIPAEQIAYIYKNNDYGFIKTFTGETFSNTYALDELQSRLDAQVFFRANRQLIVHWKACRSFSPLEYGKLDLHLQPEHKEAVIISQKKAPAFRTWLQQHK